MKIPSYSAAAICGFICMPVFAITTHLPNKYLVLFLFFVIIIIPMFFTSINRKIFIQAYQQYGSYWSYWRIKTDIHFFIPIWLKMGVFFFCGIISMVALFFIKKIPLIILMHVNCQ